MAPREHAVKDVYINTAQFTVVSGEQYWDPVTGINFSDECARDPRDPLPYLLSGDHSGRTIFGPYVPSESFIHINAEFTIKHAFAHRMLIIRGSPEEMTWGEAMRLEDEYREAQTEFCEQDIPLYKELERLFGLELTYWKGWYEEAKEHYADPHPKRELRIAAWNEMHESLSSATRLWLRNQRVIYKLKRDEIAKFEKAARMIGDLGVAASLQGFCITGRLKNAMAANDIVIGDARYRFCKQPATKALREAFHYLMRPPEKHFFVYFSDDSCYSRRCDDGSIRNFNVDISKCDASHTPALFGLLERLVPAHAKDDIRILIEQCTAPIVITSPTNKKKKVVLQPNGPRLYSGSTLTTVINNLANLIVGWQLVAAADCNITTLVASVAKCGYVVTIDENRRPEDIQFLKNSPTRDISGIYQPVLNVGVLLRSTGTCKGEIPGKIPLAEKGRAFQSALLRGMYPRTTTPFLTRMRDACAGSEYDEVERYAKRTLTPDLTYKAIGDEELTFSTDCFFARYNLSVAQIATLMEGLGDAGYGERHTSTAASVILHKDYGLQCPGCPVPADQQS
jgi:hypothetical protein